VPISLATAAPNSRHDLATGAYKWPRGPLAPAHHLIADKAFLHVQIGAPSNEVGNRDAVFNPPYCQGQRRWRPHSRNFIFRSQRPRIMPKRTPSPRVQHLLQMSVSRQGGPHRAGMKK
jgi:hypothetical protein